MRLTLGGSTSTLGGQPAARITFSPSPPWSVPAATATGTQVATATTSTVGNGTWTLTRTSGAIPDFLRLRTTAGKTVVIETSRQTDAAETGSGSYRLEYIGDGLGSPLLQTFTASVVSAVITLSFDPASPTVTVGTASGTTVTTVTATGGVGNGSWATTATNYGLFTVSGSGASRPVTTTRAVVESDVGTRVIGVRYSEVGRDPVTASADVSVQDEATRTWASGVSDNGMYGTDISAVDVFKNAHGVNPAYMTIFSGSPSGMPWSSFAAAMGDTTSKLYKIVKWCKDNSCVPIISVPVCQYNDYNGSTRLADFGRVNRGDYDTAITTFAQRVKTVMGTSTVIFRVGHEATHFPWRLNWELFNKVDGPAEAIAAWRRVITKLRDGMGPTGDPLIDYCSTAAWTGPGGPGGKGLGFLMKSPYNKTYEEAFDVFYPGNDYVDIIGFDIYDGGALATATNATTWIPQNNRKRHYDLAVAKSKKFGVDEWGIGRRHTAVGAGASSFAGYAMFPPGQTEHKAVWSYYGDNPNFIANMFSWFAGMNQTVLLYESYFRMFEAGFSQASVATGEHNQKPAIHALYQRAGANVAYKKTPFRGMGERITTTDAQGRKIISTAGELVGFDHPGATGNATAKYRLLWFGLTT